MNEGELEIEGKSDRIRGREKQTEWDRGRERRKDLE